VFVPIFPTQRTHSHCLIVCHLHCFLPIKCFSLEPMMCAVMTSKSENLSSETSYCHSSDFNLLHYTPIGSSKKLPKRWFPDLFPQYADYQTPEKSTQSRSFSPSTPHLSSPRSSFSHLASPLSLALHQSPAFKLGLLFPQKEAAMNQDEVEDDNLDVR